MMYCKKYIVSRLILLVGTFFWACSSENVSVGNDALDGTINGVSQKGPFLEGSSVTMQELDENSLAQTGKSFKGKVVNDRGDFSIENVALDHPYALLEVNGYYRNEVTGKKSNGSIFMKALADVSKQPKVNINLLTHLEYERVQTLMEQNNVSIEEAKQQADREIFAAFYADVDYDKVEYLNIFGNSEGDAALLAINVLLLGEESDASFMERFALMGQDFAADGVWNDSSLKMKIADFACKANRSGKLAEIRKNIESWKIADVPAFETYVNRFWTNQYGLGKCDASNLGMRKLFIDDSRSSVFRDSAFKCTENGWAPYSSNEVYSKSVDVECTAENEGEVKVVWVGNPKYGYDTYNRCESGLWVRGNIGLTCDTTGVQVGDLCRKTGTINIFQAGMNATLPKYVFVYAGNGAWMDVKGYFEMTKKCTAENEGDKEKFVVGKGADVITSYYACSNGEWTEIYEKDYHCATEKAVVGDTCSFESENGMQHYLFMHSESDDKNFWAESNVNPELGYCPIRNYGFYHKKDGKYYYCTYGEWLQTDLVPRQYTDSRKEGLTDEEFDVLDLPKDAKVGDRVGGLLESCWYNDELGVGGASLCPDIGEWKFAGYSYCMPQNYYRYRKNGSWTLETQEDLDYDPQFHGELCTAEREGDVTVFPPTPRDPGSIFKCTSGCDILEGYIFGRTE